MKTDTIFEHIPLISVAMTTYNGEKYLREQIDSILNQTYQNLEIVICDDCSTDGTFGILEEYGRRDSRIKLRRNERNLGFIKNFEQAVSLCTGDFIALSDQDDIWEPWKLEESVKNIEGYDLLCTNSLLVDEDGESLGYTLKDSLECHSIPNDQEMLFKHLCFHNFVQGATILAPASFLKSVAPVPEKFMGIGLHDYWYALNAINGNGIVYLDVCSLRYRQHGRQVTVNTKRPHFSQQLVTTLSSDEQANHICWCDKHSVLQDVVLHSFALPPEKSRFIEDTKKYFEHMKDKDWFTFCFFVKYHDAMYLDKNFFRKTLRITKRLLGLMKYKILG
ncbi:MAG: glycosyltransferase family 2 protein [Treponema sp.]|nr:glycosyltransferase family 2 protein [Treponema sp.]